MTNKEKTDIIIEAAKLAGYQYSFKGNSEHPHVFKAKFGSNISFEDTESWQDSMRDSLLYRLGFSYNDFIQNPQFILNNQIKDENVYNNIESLLMKIPVSESRISWLKEPLMDDCFGKIAYNKKESQDDRICFTYYTGIEGKEQNFFFNNWEEANKEAMVTGGFPLDKELAEIVEKMGFFGKDIINAIIQMNEEKFGKKTTIQDIGFDDYVYNNDALVVCETETYLDGDRRPVRVEAEIDEEEDIYKLNTYMYSLYGANNMKYLIGEIQFDSVDEFIDAIQKFNINSLVDKKLFHEAVIEDDDGVISTHTEQGVYGMDIYNYYDAVAEDLKECIKENLPDKEDWDEFRDQFGDIDKDKVMEHISEIALVDDAVTGNGSGSYTFSSIDAEQNLVGNHDLLAEAMEQFGLDEKAILKTLESPEEADVTIRCYLIDQILPDALEEVMDEMDINNEIMDISVSDKLQDSKEKADGINSKKESKAVTKTENEIS